eukprot:c13403_g1_i1 orf=257-1171(-)
MHVSLLKMEIVGYCSNARHTPPCHPHAPRLNMKLMGHGPQTLCWKPLAAERLPKMHGRGASLSKRMITVVASSAAHEGTLPASTPPPPSNDNGFFQPASSASSSARPSSGAVRRAEELLEKAIFNCRFFTLMAVVGSLAGSILCFFKGCAFVVESFREYFLTCFNGIHTGKVILLLVEAVDVYLMGTVMLIFGMGVYELFISTLDVPTRAGGDSSSGGARRTICGSSLFGLFQLTERPKWLEVRSLDELKTKLGHVIVMILLVGMFEKSKKVPIHSGVDLLCFSASILLSSGCLYLLSRLHSTH